MTIYLDHHSTTPMLPEVWEAMRPFALENYGNPSSSHSVGRKARQALEDARECIAHLLQAFPDEVIFTSGATEANNLALFGLAGAPPGHLLASGIEHPCVIEPLKQLASNGFEVEYLPVQPDGTITPAEMKSRVRTDTLLVAMMLVNHETGTLQPVAGCASLSPNIAFHTDAAQAVGKLPVRFHELGVSSLSVSGHKFGGPKGIGLLLLKRSISLHPQLFGGHQQQGRRPGTEPVALVVGLKVALEIATGRMEESAAHVTLLRHAFVQRLREGASPIVVNGSAEGSPYVVNVAFPGCRADLLLMKLDLADVACSTGSACSSGSLLPSPVLQAMNVPAELLGASMRFSFSPSLGLKEIATAATRILNAVKDLRSTNIDG